MPVYENGVHFTFNIYCILAIMYKVIITDNSHCELKLLLTQILSEWNF